MGDLDARVATSRMKCKCSGLEAAEFESSPVSNVCMRTLAFVIVGLLVTSFSYAAVQNTPVRECCNDLNKSTVCLTDAEVLTQVKHIEMLPDRMGNRINIKGEWPCRKCNGCFWESASTAAFDRRHGQMGVPAICPEWNFTESMWTVEGDVLGCSEHIHR